MPGNPDRFVVDALHQAAIARDYPGPVINQIIAKDRIQVSLCHRHANCHRKALPQRSGGAFNAFEQKVFRMSGARRAQLAEVANVLHRRARIAGEMQQRVDEHRAMPGRKHKTIAVSPIGARGIKLQVICEEHAGHIGHTHRHARVTGIRSLNGIHRQSANGIGHGAQTTGVIRHG